nr:TIGR02206 family membrane protein [Streptococcus halichoeri]
MKKRERNAMDFFNIAPGSFPQPSVAFYISTLLMAPLLILMTWRYHHNRYYRACFLILQFSQLLALYGWFALKGFPLSEALPLYHCRIGMLAIFFFPDKSRLKQLFMLLGVAGSLLALCCPDFYPYPLFHVSNVAFYLGHYMLLVNAMIYLFQYYQPAKTSLHYCLTRLAVINALIVAVNTVTGGNYGFLADPPIIHTHFVPVNFLLVTGVLVLIAKLVELIWLKLIYLSQDKTLLLSK